VDPNYRRERQTVGDPDVPDIVLTVEERRDRGDAQQRVVSQR